jgi:hypothetical protein
MKPSGVVCWTVGEHNIKPGDTLRFGPLPSWWRMAVQWLHWRLFRGPEPSWALRTVVAIHDRTLTIDRASSGVFSGKGYHKAR